MTNENGIESWLLRNSWAIIVGFIAVVALVVRLQWQVTANAKELEDQRTLIERIIVLEEHDKNTEGDLGEIKQDIKEIKAALNVHVDN